MAEDIPVVSELVIEVAPPSIVAIEQPPEVTVLALAEQGPPGRPGIDAGSSYVHQQVSPSPNWVINHNLGFRPTVSLLSVGGVEIEGEIIHVSENIVSVFFVIPVAGSARCH
jgi:hypothetical protein